MKGGIHHPKLTFVEQRKQTKIKKRILFKITTKQQTNTPHISYPNINKKNAERTRKKQNE